MNVLLLYASTHGHTARIAGRIAEAVRGADIEVDVRDAKRDAPAELSQYDGVVVGASLHGAHHQHEIVDWVKDHLEPLEDRQTAFFSVSLTAAEDTEEAREATRKCIEDFEAETGWRPGRTVAVAGALQYREYDVFTRTLIRLMMKRGGHPTDTSHDHDYTDWDAVDRFGREFAEALAEPRAR